jgi:hypothetical protein
LATAFDASNVPSGTATERSWVFNDGWLSKGGHIQIGPVALRMEIADNERRKVLQPTRYSERWIVTQGVEVVGVLVATGNRHDAGGLAQHDRAAVG